MQRIQNYIGGKFCDPVHDMWIDNYAPAYGNVYAQIPDSDAEDVQAAVDAAKAAFRGWAKMASDKKYHYLAEIATRIDAKSEELARAESLDTGKPLQLATTVDIPRASSNFRFFSTALMQFASESHATGEGVINYTLRQPIGVCGCISPWNLPLYLFTWKIAPALAAGNTVVAKPSEITPMTAFLLAQICDEVGLPPGVLNVVQGYGTKAGAAIVAHPDVKAISFTGGTKTGTEISRIAAPMFKKLSLELGGKNPNLIFDDCHFSKMLEGTLRSSFSNQGQICLCGSRIYVQDRIYGKFKTAFVERTAKLKVGDPNDPLTDLGAISSEAHLQKILSYVALAKREGGRILTGGHQVTLDGDLRNGWYVAPTIIEGLGPECRTNQEEIFGPVVTITPFSTEEEVVRLANSTPYGLSSTIWTEDLSRAHRIAQRIESGIVWINCWLLRDLRTPFGGMKNSGVGREGGFEAMRFFTEAKNVCIRFGDE
ncbi:MAG TPA: aldehyde dehydrogenase [Saprospiraceae bacterium]|nr:aldehyde dehydrogenase [Saprospiraceae bacterium]